MSLLDDFISNLTSAIFQKKKEEEDQKKKQDQQRRQFNAAEFSKNTTQNTPNNSRVVNASDLQPDLLPKTTNTSAQMRVTPQSLQQQKQNLDTYQKLVNIGRQNIIETPAIANAAYDTIAPKIQGAADLVHHLVDKTGAGDILKKIGEQPINPTFGQYSPTNQQATSFVGNLVRDTLRSVPRAIQSIKQTDVNIPEYKPTSNLEKFLYGNEPVKSIQQQGEDIKKFENKYNVPKWLQTATAVPIAGALTVSDALPVLPEKHAAQKILAEEIPKGLEKLAQVAATHASPEEFLNAAKNIKIGSQLISEDAAKTLFEGIKPGDEAGVGQRLMDFYKRIHGQNVGIPKDLISAADNSGALKASINKEAGSLPASTNLEPSQTSITGGFEPPIDTRKTLSSNRTNFVSSFMSKSPSQDDYSRYFRTMQEQEPNFLSSIDKVAKDVNGDVAYRMKSPESLARKITTKNKPLGDMNDTLAATITVDHPSEVDSALESAKRNLNITKVDDFRQHPTLFGYKAIHLDYELPNGAIAEVQLNTKAGMEGKQWAHDIYDKWRKYIINNGSTTVNDVVNQLKQDPEKINEFYRDVQLSRDIYDGKVEVPSHYLEKVGQQFSDTRAKIDNLTTQSQNPIDNLPLSTGAKAGNIENIPLTPGSKGGNGINPPENGSISSPENIIYNEPKGKIMKEKGAGKFQYDVSSLGTPEEVKNTILESVKNANTEGILQTQRRGSMTETQIRTMANNLGMSYDDVVKRKPGQIWNAEQADAANRLMLDVNEKLFEASRVVNEFKQAGHEVPGDLLTKQMELAARAQGITASVIGDRSEAGRALRAAQMFKESLENPDAKSKLISDATKMFAGDEKKAARVIQRLSEFDPEDKVGMMKFLRQVKPSSTLDKIEEYWYNSILSNSATHIFNDVGNTISTMIDIPERAVSGVIDAALSGISGKTRERYVAEAAAEVSGISSGIADGFRRAVKVMAHGISESDVNKLEYSNQAIKGVVGNIINIPSRALVAQDELFKGINYEMELRAQALRLAKQEGKTGEEFTKRYAELLEAPPAQMMEKANEAAKIRLFQGDSVSANAVRYFRDNLFKISAGPLGDIRPVKFIIPFVQTPVNVLKFGLERTPAGFLSAGYKAISGKTKGEVSDSLARAFIGSSLMVPLATYFQQGKITGAAPTDKKLRDAFYADGKLPWSVKIGDNWVAYNRIEPLNSILAQIAQWHDAFQNHNNVVSIETISDFLKNSGKNFADQTFMTGIGNLVNAIEDPQNFGQKFITDIVGGFIPSFVAAGARATDNIVRQPKTFKDSLLARLPYYSKQTPGQSSDFEPGGMAIRHTNEGTMRNIASNFIGLRTSPDNGLDAYGQTKEIKDLAKEDRARSDAEKETAQKIFDKLQDTPKADRQSVIEQYRKEGLLTDRVQSKLQSVIRDYKVSAVGAEKVLQGASNRTRAMYMYDHLKDMSTEDRHIWLKNAQQKKIVTSGVIKEFNALIKQKQQDTINNLPLTP